MPSVASIEERTSVSNMPISNLLTKNVSSVSLNFKVPLATNNIIPESFSHRANLV